MYMTEDEVSTLSEKDQAAVENFFTKEHGGWRLTVFSFIKLASLVLTLQKKGID